MVSDFVFVFVCWDINDSLIPLPFSQTGHYLQSVMGPVGEVAVSGWLQGPCGSEVRWALGLDGSATVHVQLYMYVSYSLLYNCLVCLP